MWGAYFCMGAYKCNVVVVIKNAWGAYYPDFTVYGSLHKTYLASMMQYKSLSIMCLSILCPTTPCMAYSGATTLGDGDCHLMYRMQSGG